MRAAKRRLPSPKSWHPGANASAAALVHSLHTHLKPSGKEHRMAKGQRRSNKEARKPKKAPPPKLTPINSALKGTPLVQPLKKS
jgi:hypothetical protein